MTLSKQTVHKIADDPEEVARQLLESIGTDALEDWIERVRQVWCDEGSHK